MALVEWGDAAEPVLGDGALSVLLVTDPDDDDRRVITVAADGAAWADRWSALTSAIEPWRVDA